MQVVVTAGASEHTCSAVGLVKSTIDEVLTPMKASALYVGMRFAKPLAFFEAMGVSGERLVDFSKTFMNSLDAPLGACV